MTDEIVIGKIGLTPKGEYVSGEIYEILDVVSNDGNSYVSRIAENDQPLTNDDAWMLSAKKGGQGIQGDTFTFEDLTTEQKEELKGDVIIYNSMTESEKDDFASRVPITGVVQEGNTQAVSGGEVYKVTKDLQEITDYSSPTTLGLIRENGSIGTNTTNADLSSVIPVNLGDIIEYKGTVGVGGLAVAGYNSNITDSSTLVSALLVSGTYTTVQKIEITNPDIKFIRASSRNLTFPDNTNILYVKKVVNVMPKIKSEILELQNNQIDPNIYLDITGVKSNGMSVRTDNGNLSDLTNVGFPDTEFSDFIPVNSIDKFYVDGWFGGNVGIAGYDQNKVYNSRLADTSNSSVNKVEYADNYELIIPEDVKFIRGGTKDRDTYPLRVSTSNKITDVVASNTEDINELKSLSQKSIVVNYVSPSNFTVKITNKDTGKSVIHNFIRSVRINSFDSVVDMKTEDIWYTDSIIVDGAIIAQGNLNFIYMIYAIGDKVGENGHVGAGHGCIVQKWTKFYVDGKEFNPTEIFTELSGQTFSMSYYADCYAINKSISPSGANGLPKLDIDNNPIIANNSSIDVTYYSNGIIEHRNILYIKRDNTSFTQCHGAMNSCFRPYFDKVLVPNKEEFTINQHYIEEGSVIVNPLYGSAVNTLITDRLYSNEVIQKGADGYNFSIKNTIINMDNTKQNNSNLNFYYGTSPNWLKVYMQPVICRDNPDSDNSLAEVFNIGDVIDVLVKREVFI